MTSDELTHFWSAVADVARAIEAAFSPVHLNVQLLGNAVPHVRVHIVARYDPDPAPSRPLPAET
jgi:diadenosine tetraphosphate (Ap4A) HIT family hydrolase